MSSAGTLLSELDTTGPSSSQDNDLVQKILSDMNGGGGNGNTVQMPGRGMAAPPPPLPNSMTPGMVPQGTHFPTASDPLTAQAHVIGRDTPSPADFARAIHGLGGMNEVQGMEQTSTDYMYEEPKKNWYGKILEEAKTPILVALLFFTLSLPAVNLLVAHYLPSLILPTGSLTTIGLLAKSVLAGLAFWILIRVVTPLLKA